MVICPWCGTAYQTFQSNCANCGGPLPASSLDLTASPQLLQPPPAPPRPISDGYVWKLLSGDGGWIAALILSFLGGVFTILGIALTAAVLTAFVGIPFLGLGLVFLAVGVWLFTTRYRNARRIVDVLQTGATARGRISEVSQNFSVRVNGRSPWIIRYEFQVNRQMFEGSSTTLQQPNSSLQTGNETYILFSAAAPAYNSIYPHP